MNDMRFNNKFVALEPTLGYNAEVFSDRIDYTCWDVSGKLIYGGEQ